MKVHLSIYLLLSFCLAFCAAGEEHNALFNGDFSFGMEGYALYRLLNPEKNPNCTYIPLEQSQEGERSLVIHNPYGEYFQLRSAEFTLPAQADIHFRGVFRADIDCAVRASVAHVDANGRWHLGSNVVSLKANATETLDFHFTSSPDGGPCILVILPEGNEPLCGTLVISSLFISSGIEPTLLSSGHAEKTLYILEEGTDATVNLSFYNYTGSDLDGELVIEAFDQNFGSILYKESRVETLSPGINQKRYSIPLKQYGSFAVRTFWNGKPLREISAVFVVIGDYHGKETIDPLNDFCVSINGGSGLLRRSRFISGYASTGISQEEKFQMLSQMGCRIIRDWGASWNATAWHEMEPMDGEFDFQYFDHVVDMANRHNMMLMPVFGRMYENGSQNDPPFRPAWLQEKLIHIEKNPSGTNPKFVINVPPLDLWNRYVEAFAGHAGEQVKLYEVMNEPNLNLSPELYSSYMIPAAQAIHRVSPNAKVVSVCVTGDHNGELVNYLKACVKAGVLSDSDAVSFHPYNARELSSAMPADQQIADLHEIIGDKPLFNTELFFPYDHPNTINYDAQQRAKPCHVVSRFLVDLGEGVSQSMASEELVLWQQPLHPTMFPNYRTELIPNGLFVAYNALARYFECAKPIAKNKLPSGMICYLYHREGKPLAAVWKYRDAGTSTIDLTGMKVLDLFGNTVEAGIVTLTENPLYLFPGELDDATFEERCKTLTPTFVTPLEISDYVRKIGPNVYFTVQNLTSQPQEAIFAFSGECQKTVDETDILLPPYSTSSVSVPESKQPNEPVTLVYNAGGRDYRKEVTLVSSPYCFAGETLTAATEDGAFGFNGSVKHQDKKIILDFTVKDTTPAGPSNKRMPWETDGIELFFDQAPAEMMADPKKYTNNILRMFVCPYDAKPLIIWGNKISEEDCGIMVTHTDDGYRFVLSFPLETSELLGFGLVVHDASGADEKAMRTVGWGTTGDSFWNRLTFGVVNLASEDSEAEVTIMPFTVTPLANCQAKGQETFSLTESNAPALELMTTLAANTFYRLSMKVHSENKSILCLKMQQGAFADEVAPFCGDRHTLISEYFYSEQGGKSLFTLRNAGKGTCLVSQLLLEEVDLDTLNLMPDGDFEVQSGLSFWNQNSFDESLFPAETCFGESRFYGQAAMKIACHPPITSIRLASHYLPLPLNRRVEISFWAKADSHQTLQTVFNTYVRSGTHGGEHLLFWQPFVLDKEWRRYSLEFYPGNDTQRYPDLLRQLVKVQFFPQESEGNILIDNIRYRILAESKH